MGGHLDAPFKKGLDGSVRFATEFQILTILVRRLWMPRYIKLERMVLSFNYPDIPNLVDGR